jgi:hypothetical protein
MQPFSIAKLQARIIEHDETCMYEVLEDCSWDFEKVLSSYSAKLTTTKLPVVLMVTISCL